LRRPLSPWIDCLLWLFTGWLAGLTVTVSGMALERAVSPGPWFRSLLNVAPNLAGTGLVVLLGLSASRSRPATVLSLRRPPWIALPWVALSSFCLALLSAGLNTWIERVLPMPSAVRALFEQVLEYHTLSQFLGVVFFLVVVAPVTEELMFRGLFLHRLSESHGRTYAILGSALSFGVFHILPWQAIGATLIGIYLGWLVTRTGSILMPIAAHAFFNLVPVTATGLSDRVPIVRGLGAGGEEFLLAPGLLVGAALALAAGILGTLRATRQRPAGIPSGPSQAPAGPPPEPSAPH
jgi:membrane protease YdiL (CAAX protease family)